MVKYVHFLIGVTCKAETHYLCLLVLYTFYMLNVERDEKLVFNLPFLTSMSASN